MPAKEKTKAKSGFSEHLDFLVRVPRPFEQP